MKMTNMQAIGSSTSYDLTRSKRLKDRLRRRSREYLTLFITMLLLSSCAAKSTLKPRAITLQQQWTLNPGDEIAGNPVTGSLGDISLHLGGQKLYATFDETLEMREQSACTLYSTPEIPAYLFRLCGLSKVNYGEIKASKSMGKGEYLSFATLRRQPDGTWIIVEPARDVLEKALGADS